MPSDEPQDDGGDALTDMVRDDGEHRSGFVTIVGRPNVGKSTLINQLVGDKVAITSSRPNTTRFAIRGIVTRPGAQAVFVDTPGIHKPKTTLGERLNESAYDSLHDVDVVVVVIEASAKIGPGDTAVLDRALDTLRGRAGGTRVLYVVVNKVDKVGPEQVAAQLLEVVALVDKLQGNQQAVEVEFFPISAKTGKGVAALLDAILAGLPEGPQFYPAEVTTDTPEALQLAELVREQLLSRTRDELPHSIACRVTEWEWPRVRVEILVERDSQKGIVIGAGGDVLRQVGTAVRAAYAPEMFLELFVRVEKQWQRRDDALDRLGY